MSEVTGRVPSPEPDYDLNAEGWVLIADQWRWTGRGEPPLRTTPARLQSDASAGSVALPISSAPSR